MRRLVLICMMLLLPIQWTWAAAAAYCAHESSAAARHIGHHEHVHKASAAEGSKKASIAAGALDLDCDYCHLSAAQWLPALHDVLPPAMGAVSPLEDPLRVGSHIGSGPERPDIGLAV
ncbi:MAG: hypothetical protein ABT02_18465 [Comamonadaceae bacterium SCN 68-20]|nr:MAG: hypothetical protein ABT02_18465 [Comamonadaceae bacterium SCN 68-20]